MCSWMRGLCRFYLARIYSSVIWSRFILVPLLAQVLCGCGLAVHLCFFIPALLYLLHEYQIQVQQSRWPVFRDVCRGRLSWRIYTQAVSRHPIGIVRILHQKQRLGYPCLCDDEQSRTSYRPEEEWCCVIGKYHAGYEKVFGLSAVEGNPGASSGE